MRYDASHKENTRQRVLRVAAQAIRSDGPHRVGVAGIMREAGLTHGGFYAHFANKDDLVAAAIAQMFDEAMAYWQRCQEGRDDAQALAAYIDGYLTMKHRDRPGRGCPIAALGADVPRMDAPARKAFAEGSRRLHDAIAQALARSGHDEAKALASSVLAEMVGAMALARTEPDAKRAQAHLTAARRMLALRLDMEIRP